MTTLPYSVEITRMVGDSLVSTVYDPNTRCFETAIFRGETAGPESARSFSLLSAARRHQAYARKLARERRRP
jgi:hypothetical protein